MSMPATLDLTHYRGDTLGVAIKCWSDVAHTIPVDISTATITAQIKVKTGDTATVGTWEVSKQVPAGGTITSQINLTLRGDPQRSMPTKTVWDCQIDFTNDGLHTQTPVKGTLTLSDDITQTVTDDGVGP